MPTHYFLVRTTSFIMHLMKVILLACLAAIFCYQSLDQFIKFIDRQTMISSFTVAEESLQLPAATICPNPPFRPANPNILELVQSKQPNLTEVAHSWPDIWKNSTYVFGHSMLIGPGFTKSHIESNYSINTVSLLLDTE